MDIPEGVIDRLPKYARALGQLEAEGRDVVSSQELGVRLNITHAQIRKDLSYFGRFGKQGRGYNVQKLLDEMRRIVGLNRQWKMAVEADDAAQLVEQLLHVAAALLAKA